MLKQLRHHYLHLSAQKEGGKGNFTGHVSATGWYDKQGNPDREIIKG